MKPSQAQYEAVFVGFTTAQGAIHANVEALQALVETILAVEPVVLKPKVEHLSRAEKQVVAEEAAAETVYQAEKKG